MVDDRMKHCPFCGNVVEVFKRASAHEEAIEKWNRRT